MACDVSRRGRGADSNAPNRFNPNADAGPADTGGTPNDQNSTLPQSLILDAVHSMPDPKDAKTWLPGFDDLFSAPDGNSGSVKDPTNTQDIVVISPPPELRVAKGTPFSVVFRMPAESSWDVTCLPEDSLVEKSESDGNWTCTYNPKRGADGWQVIRVGNLDPVNPELSAEWRVFYDNTKPVLDSVKYKKSVSFDGVELSTAGNIMVSGLVTDVLPPQILPLGAVSVWLKANGEVKQVHFETESFFWAIIKTKKGLNSFEVFAQDSALNTAHHVLPPLVVDTVSPIMDIFSPSGPDGALIGKDMLKIWVVAQDDSGFTPTVTMDTSGDLPSVGMLLDDGKTFEFIVSAPPGSFLATFVATDVVGHTTTQVHELLFDQQPPTIEWNLPLAEGKWYNKKKLSLMGTVVTDVHSGVASAFVIVSGPNGYKHTSESVYPINREWNGQVGFSGAELPLGGDGVYEIEVVASDVVGNTASETRTFTLDTAVPTIAQEPTYFVPEWANETTEFVNGKLSMKPDGGQVMVLAESTCQGSCGTIAKHPNRLSYETSKSIAQNNLPSFKVKTTNNDGSPVKEWKYSFEFDDGGVTPQKNVPWDGVVPLSTQTIWGSDAIPDGTQPMPIALKVWVTDAAGNVGSSKFQFKLLLTTPPIPYEVVSPSPSYGPDPNVTTLSFSAKTVHLPFDGDDDDKLTAARVKFQNPYAMPIMISFNGADKPPKTSVKLKGQYYYLNGSDYTPNSGYNCCAACVPNTCSYQPPVVTAPAVCQSPAKVDQLVEDSFDFLLDDVVWHVLEAGKYKSTLASDHVILMPGEVGLADLTSWTGSETCSFPTPVQIAVQSAGGVSGASVPGMYLWSDIDSCEKPWPPGKTQLVESAWCSTVNFPLASDPCWKQPPNYCGSPNVYKRYIHARLLKEIQFTSEYSYTAPLFSAQAGGENAAPCGMVSQMMLGTTSLTNTSVPGKTSPL